jgi:hypothetical protein
MPVTRTVSRPVRRKPRGGHRPCQIESSFAETKGAELRLTSAATETPSGHVDNRDPNREMTISFRYEVEDIGRWLRVSGRP